MYVLPACNDNVYSPAVVSVSATAKAGAESAIWDEAGTTLTLNLVKDKTNDQKTIDNLIANAKQEQSSATATPAQVSVKLSSDLTAMIMYILRLL